jgi:hypothetical protein
MKYKILTPNTNGMFEFSKEELEKTMTDIYDEGYNDGYRDGQKFTITTPSYPPNPITYPSITWSDKTTPLQYDTWMGKSTTPVSTTTAYWTGTDPAARDCTTTNPAIRNDPSTLTGDANGK